MMRLWANSYSKSTPVMTSATLSIVAHTVVIAAWVVSTMPAPDIEAAIDALEDAIQARHPEVIAVFVKPEDKVDQIVLPGRFPGRSRRLSGRTGGNATSTGQRA